ncbi:hypothetical protein MKW98_030073 [Papaver atlanticum]|uniref:Wound-responsive family protein n=1 Tax=Papaver atlanticum TaxID=357466 RepID=A0AAD4T561_9MAGN|nr:hypothetical protein MKW98_030073 [Papaver atlanticum]
MSSTSKAWMVAVSVGVVEALKDQDGICRWNYALRSIHQYTKNRVKSSISQATSSSSIPASSVIAEQITMIKKQRDHEMRQSEESLRKLIYLSFWGPN